MSFQLALTLAGINSHVFDNIGRLLDVRPRSSSLSSSGVSSTYSLNSAEPSSTVEIVQGRKFNGTRSATQDLHLQFSDSSNKLPGLGNVYPTWWQLYPPAPIENAPGAPYYSKDRCYHILGLNEEVSYMPGDDEGFAVPIPYRFNSDGTYSNYFGGDDGTNNCPTYHSDDSNEEVKAVWKSAQELTEARRNLVAAANNSTVNAGNENNKDDDEEVAGMPIKIPSANGNNEGLNQSPVNKIPINKMKNENTREEEIDPFDLLDTVSDSAIGINDENEIMLARSYTM